MALLDRFRPHLARAAPARPARCRQPGCGHATGGVALRRMGGRSARLLAANELFEAMAPRVRFAAFGRLSFADPEVDRLAQAAMASIGSEADPAVRSIPIHAAADAPALVVHLLPVRRAGGDIFVEAEASSS